MSAPIIVKPAGGWSEETLPADARPIVTWDGPDLTEVQWLSGYVIGNPLAFMLANDTRAWQYLDARASVGAVRAALQAAGA